MSDRRLPVLVALATVVAGIVVADRVVPSDPGTGFGDVGSFVMPVADRASALSSTWYCAAGAADGDGAGDLTVTVANPVDAARPGTVSWFPSEGAVVTADFEVAGGGVTTLAASEAVTAPVVSAVVETRGGGVAVEHRLGGPQGSVVAPCASGASPRWYLANGATTVDARQRLFLFNPFPEDAIVDVTFATDQGRDRPPGLVGLPIASGSTKVIEVGEFVRRREVTATSVVARSGRLVVDRLQGFDPAGGRSGLSLALAAPSPAQVWTFPDGVYGEGTTERWHVYNPGDRDAVVALELVPEGGEAIEPLELTVPGQAQVVVDASDPARVAPGTRHASVVRSRNGVPVVAERQVDARSSPRGWSSSLGAPRPFARWVVAAGGGDEVEESLALYNPGAEPVKVTARASAEGRVAPVEGLEGVELGPSGRAVVELAPGRPPRSVVVEAGGPVVVARELDRVGEAGLSTAVGVPLS